MSDTITAYYAAHLYFGPVPLPGPETADASLEFHLGVGRASPFMP